FGAWVELLVRPGMVAVLAFILLFKLGDAAMGFMVKPFWVDAGFSAGQIGVEPGHQAIVYAASALESFTGGLGTGAFLAFLMGITSKARATTEYAILSSIFAFSRAVAGWAGGIGAQELGYPVYFLLTFFLSFPAYLLLPPVRRMLERSDDARV
ncbi:MAG TPA: MFS transporter, partial [Methylibium sp.]|nr:MFS transporter [Methylibium sp.]